MNSKILLMLFLSLVLVHSTFQMKSVVIDMHVQEDGSVQVTEKFDLFIVSNDSVSLYRGIMADNNIEDWRTSTGIGEIRYHTNANVVNVSNVQLQPRAPDPCNEFLDTCYGTLFIKYTIPASENLSLFRTEMYKPRTTRYVLNSGAFSFETTEQNDIILPENTLLNIYLPQKALVTNLNPQPSNINDTSLPIMASVLTWVGRSKLSPFELTFETEQPLSQEVLDFFNESEAWFFTFIYSRDGVASIIIILVAIIALYLLRRGAK